MHAHAPCFHNPGVSLCIHLARTVNSPAHGSWFSALSKLERKPLSDAHMEHKIESALVILYEIYADLKS